jgi:ribosome-associated protein
MEPPRPPGPPKPPPPPPPPPSRRDLARRAKLLDDDTLMGQCTLDVFIAGGPGGQHRNKTESGVRLVHPPTGVTVTATERRSQLQNKGVALERLRKTLEELAFVPKVRRPTKRSRGSQERRLEGKKKASAVKRDRRSTKGDRHD